MGELSTISEEQQQMYEGRNVLKEAIQTFGIFSEEKKPQLDPSVLNDGTPMGGVKELLAWSNQNSPNPNSPFENSLLGVIEDFFANYIEQQSGPYSGAYPVGYGPQPPSSNPVGPNTSANGAIGSMENLPGPNHLPTINQFRDMIYGGSSSPSYNPFSHLDDNPELSHLSQYNTGSSTGGGGSETSNPFNNPANTELSHLQQYNTGGTPASTAAAPASVQPSVPNSGSGSGSATSGFSTSQAGGGAAGPGGVFAPSTSSSSSSNGSGTGGSYTPSSSSSTSSTSTSSSSSSSSSSSGGTAVGTKTSTTSNGGTVPTTITTYGGGTSNYNSSTGMYGSIPIILDLAGNGIKIDQLSTSQKFIDSNGDGLLHRTAWAGAGNGVLFYDPDGRNAITEDRQYIFTKWDPTATSDVAALRSAFDSNGDGKLTTADAEFAKFKLEVTNADGSTSVKTLTELGITEINLSPDATSITLPDGSSIQGQTTYTKSDGTTGTVADAILATDATGRNVVQTVSTDANGNRVLDTKAYDASGTLAFATHSVTNADGTNVENDYDDNGDGRAANDNGRLTMPKAA